MKTWLVLQMSTHHICFCGEIKKNIYLISFLIWSYLQKKSGVIVVDVVCHRDSYTTRQISTRSFVLQLFNTTSIWLIRKVKSGYLFAICTSHYFLLHEWMNVQLDVLYTFPRWKSHAIWHPLLTLTPDAGVGTGIWCEKIRDILLCWMNCQPNSLVTIPRCYYI